MKPEGNINDSQCYDLPLGLNKPIPSPKIPCRPRGDLACALRCVLLFSTSCIKESSEWPAEPVGWMILGWSALKSVEQFFLSNWIHLKIKIGTTISGRFQKPLHHMTSGFTTNYLWYPLVNFQNDGKSQFLMGKLTISTGPWSIPMLVFTRRYIMV